MSARRIAIIGSGMGGMSCALALRHRGHEVTLFERFSTPRPVGAGLLLQPTGQAALRELGLLSKIEAASARVDQLIGRDPSGRIILDLAYGRRGTDVYGLGVHRGVLFNALYDEIRSMGIDQVLDADVESVDTEKGIVSYSHGCAMGPFDLVVVADGAHSRLRERLFGSRSSSLYKWGALWTVVADPENRCAGALRQVYDKASVMIGLLPVGTGPVGHTPQCALFWSLPIDAETQWKEAGLKAWSDRIARYWPEAGNMAHTVESPDGVSLAIYRDTRLNRWRCGRAILIGDAAHATSPQLGQGANLALVDGIALAQALEKDPNDMELALDAFVRARLRLVRWTRIMSRLLTPAFQSSVPGIGVARNMLLRLARRVPAFDQLMLRTLTGEQGFWG